MTVHPLRRKPVTVPVHAQDLADWQRRTRDIAASHHAQHHAEDGYPYSWDRCPSETCWMLRNLADQIEDELELYFPDDEDDN